MTKLLGGSGRPNTPPVATVVNITNGKALNGFITSLSLNLINPFQPGVAYLYPLKTSRGFRGYR